jgi:putative PIN family toxin of toxin-antitoxin system
VSARVVVDANVIIASRRSSSEDSPDTEALRHWEEGRFIWLISKDVLREYARKLMEVGVADADVESFLARLIVAAESVQIAVFHERNYPEDNDDIAFLLCAINGRATHLVTYDRHLTALEGHYDFRICGPRDLIADLAID